MLVLGCIWCEVYGTDVGVRVYLEGLMRYMAQMLVLECIWCDIVRYMAQILAFLSLLFN